jgi:quinohemoprotein ethanol dehydrogenase
MRTSPLTITAALACLALLSACGQSSTQATSPALAGGDFRTLPTDAWPANGGDWYNRNYSPLAEIDRGNVSRLKGVWRARLGGSGVGPQYSGAAQPIMHEGVIYVITGAHDVFAIDVESGAILWTYEANLGQITTVCCGWTSRGVALGEDKIFVGRLDAHLVALDRRTGEVLWEVEAERWQDGYTITSAPLYYDGLVITGFAGGERGIRGKVKAFDASDGSPVWTFNTIPGPGEYGHDTWPADNDLWRHGGAPVWQTPAVDPELGLVYFSTGNPGPDYNGAFRAGDNLFSVSMLAVDAYTGEYRWHFQQVRHDLWDYDAANPMVLFDIEIGGVDRKGVAQASKTGWVYILDRTDGEPLIGIEDRPVPQEPRQATAATQPYPVGDAFVPQSIPIEPEGFRLVNEGRIFTPFWADAPVPVKPGVAGGANWPPSAYDPQSGWLYVCATDRAWAFIAEEIDDKPPQPGDSYIAGGFGGFPLHSLGTFTAMDMATNRIVWQQHWPEPCYSGAVATAGGLVFVGRSDGRLTALDSSDGTLLWQFQTGAGMNAPVSVFEHGGRQYVVAYSAGNMFAGSPRGDSVWLFALDGTLEQAEPASAAPAGPMPGGGPAAAVNAANGLSVYEAACSFCHGDQGQGGHAGPAFTGEADLAAIARVVSEGRAEMPGFSGTLSPEQIRDVGAHVAEMLSR